jgi:hypothetical protein
LIVINKYQDRLPLDGIEGILKRNGIDIPRNTLARWMIKCGELVQPLMNLLEEKLLESNYIKMDICSASTRGAKASANLYSLIETAKANGIESFKYLKHVFTELPAPQTIEQIEKLLTAYFVESNALSRDVD